MIEPQQKWDKRYQEEIAHYPEACCVLQQNQHLLPKQGKALDLACGLGANALLLASLGLQTHAWGISGEALIKLSAEAGRRQLDLVSEQRDVSTMPPEISRFDVIVVSHFLDRALFPHLINALKPNGLVFYQTYCRDNVNASGPQNPEFLLKDNELLTVFSGLMFRVYREESLLGNVTQGWRNRAMLVAQKC